MGIAAELYLFSAIKSGWRHKRNAATRTLYKVGDTGLSSQGRRNFDKGGAQQGIANLRGKERSTGTYLKFHDWRGPRVLVEVKPQQKTTLWRFDTQPGQKTAANKEK